VGEYTDWSCWASAPSFTRQISLTRAYYSRFSPVSNNTPFENVPEVAPLRERAAVQASFLLRDYAWEVGSPAVRGVGTWNWASIQARPGPTLHLLQAPVDLMRADREQLLLRCRESVRRAWTRSQGPAAGRLRDLTSLHRLGIQATRAAPYIVMDGYRPPQQVAVVLEAGEKQAGGYTMSK
jgi:predicted DNA-binding helix-hairpin-helix protein